MELLAALVLMDLRMDEAKGDPTAAGFAGAISGQTDSLGSMYTVAKLYTGAEPGASIVRTMAARCAERTMVPSLVWESRASNTWADDLSKGRCAGFAPFRRHVVEWSRYQAIQEDYLMFSGQGRTAQLKPPVDQVTYD